MVGSPCFSERPVSRGHHDAVVGIRRRENRYLPGDDRLHTVKRRHGFTLIETITVLVLLMLVAGTVGVTLVRQQQFYRGAGELIQARQGVRDASELMSADLRAISLEDTVRFCEVHVRHHAAKLPVAEAVMREG